MPDLSWQNAIILAVSLFAVFAAQKVIEFRQKVAAVKAHAGTRNVFWGGSVLGNLLPPLPWIAPGQNFEFRMKHTLFAKVGWDILSDVSAFPSRVSFTLADVAAIKEVTGSRGKFSKPVEQYSILAVYGPNIVASEGDTWKKYRKISAPAFSDRNNILVWDETIKIMLDLFENVWGEQESIVTDHAVDVTLPIALFVIGVAGFGRKITWKDDLVVPPGHEMTFKDSLHIVSTDVFMTLLLPDWAMGVSERTSKLRTALKELKQYMAEMIDKRRNSDTKEERYDLFSSLLDASNAEDTEAAKLTDDELIGNIFIFLIAGHETTAHTLCYTFALLALYPEIQEKLHRNITDNWPEGRLPSYDEMNKFEWSIATFYETMRMYPPVILIPKKANEDCVLVASNLDGDTKPIPIPAGSSVNISVPGLHYNPKYWPEPEKFDPTRFLNKDWPRDAFLPFSMGNRACIGRKFFETEGIAILTMLISKYKVEIKEEPQFANETLQQRQERVMNCRAGLTMTPIRVPLVFKRR